jgi:hypothetical protein
MLDAVGGEFSPDVYNENAKSIQRKAAIAAFLIPAKPHKENLT